MHYQTIAHDLRQTSVAHFTCPNESDLILSVIKDFIRLTEESPEYRDSWAVDNNVLGGDQGLLRRDKEKGGYDNKFFFHYRKDLTEKLSQRSINLMFYRRFLHNLDILHSKLALIAESIMIELGEQMPELRLIEKFDRTNPVKRYVLRLLYYQPDPNMLATRHEDRDFLTLHVADSQPGLLIGDSVIPLQTEPEKMTAFTGIKAKILSDGILKSVPHSVIADPAQIENRWAVVFFTHIDLGEEMEKKVKRYALARKDFYLAESAPAKTK